jgi:MoaA/NifB/PqqE/SkfB family radical SAM enzyme
LDLSRFEEIIDTLRKRKVEDVFVNGHGETTILKDWVKYINRLALEKFNLGIVTHLAHKYTDEAIEAFSRFHTIKISCDFIDPELFSRVRRGADFKIVLDNISRIKTLSNRQGRIPKLSIFCVLFDKNIYLIEDFVRFWLSIGVDDFWFCNLVKQHNTQQSFRMKNYKKPKIN